MPLPNNLDYFIANSALSFAQEGNNDRKNAIQKAISILSSQGLFAMFLWAYTKTGHEENDGKFLVPCFVDIFHENEIITLGNPNNTSEVLNNLKENLQDFQKIRFLEDISMRILIYARHYLKSLT